MPTILIIIIITILYHFSASTFRSNSRKAVAAETTSEYSFGDNSAALTRCSHASKCRDIVVRNSATPKNEMKINYKYLIVVVVVIFSINYIN